jgi:hypothetical protein
LRCIEADIERRGDCCEFFIIKVINSLHLRILVGHATQDRAERPGIVDRKHRLQHGATLLKVDCFEEEAGLRHVGSSS